MPIIKSAKKRVRQTIKRKTRNQNLKRELRAETKTLMAAIGQKNAKKAAEQLTKVQSQLDKAVKKNILKKNTAARKLSQLTAKVKALGAKPASSAKSKPTAAAKKPVAKTTSKTSTAKVKKAPAKKPVAKTTAAKKPVATKKKSTKSTTK